MKQLLTAGLLMATLTGSAQNYWQQRVDTKIEVRLDDRTNMVHAREEMVYTNNSPDTLKFLFIHLWPNAYKNDHTPFEHQMDVNGNSKFYYAKEEDRGYIDSLDFTIDGQTVDHNIADNTPDIARIDLPTPLLPGHHVTIITPFRVKMPIVFSRMGHSGQAYYVTQWFPKPAVYDRLGWHPISYLDQGEFFSEYGSYDVSITVPKNYVVMATGNCLDATENSWLDSLASVPLVSDKRMFATAKTMGNDTFPESSREYKTLHYHEDNVHDFAWFADKRWLVRKDTVIAPGTTHVVTAWAAFLPSYKNTWINATQYLTTTVQHYGTWVGSYPYNTIKAVLGDMHAGGGMEYPTITIIDKNVRSGLSTVVIHEAGHNWFYGMLGTNERDHAWMDEGINTFYEKKTTRILDTTKKVSGQVASLNEDLFYYELADIHQDQPIDQTAAKYAKLNYGIDVYYKTALMLRWLERYMGNDNFEKGMHEYFDLWHYKHPYPADFRACMQHHTTKSLDWFFDGVMFTTHKIDFSITDAYSKDGALQVAVRNNSDLKVPVQVNVYSGDSVVATQWTEPFEGETHVTIPANEWTKVIVDELTPDAKLSNSVYRRYGLAHHFALKVKPFFGLNRSYQDKIFISAAAGYNFYDGKMLGLMFHDLSLPENRFRYAIAPMYAFGSKDIVGAGSAGYVWYPGGAIRELMLQADAKTFHDNEGTGLLANTQYASYMKVAPSLNFTFNEFDPLSPVTRILTLKGYYINEQMLGGTELYPSLSSQTNYYGRITYRHGNDRTYNPFSYSGDVHGNGDFVKINIEGSARVDYNVPKKSLYVRAYLGKFFAIDNDPSVTSRYYLNASYSGIDDYLYDGTFLGRNCQSRLPAQQISIQEGGFKVPVFNNVDRSDNWMATVNLKTDLPLKAWPIRLFLDAGLIPNADPSASHSSSTTLLYDGGLEVHVYKDVVNVYFPIIMSSDFQNYLKNSFGMKNVFARSISFNFDLQRINWLRSPTSILKSTAN